MVLSKDQILAAEDLETREVECPAWGGSVLLRALDGTARDAYESSLSQVRQRKDPRTGRMIREPVPDTVNARAKLVARAIVDEQGERIFKDSDIAALGKKSAQTLDMLFEIVAEMSGITEEDIEAIEGNSEAAPSGDSTSS